ncbi:MAG: class I SAM-dependent methyltransferase [Planctomycetes bacterium]|nr:class I SAM-dependent methyltransferase [Planctomycetota bacterium]
MFEVRYPIRDDCTGREGVLRLAGGIWTGDVCGFEFTDTVYGLGGTATCDWRESRARLWIDEGVPSDPGAQALLDRISTLLLPFHRGAFRHLTQRDVRRCNGSHCDCPPPPAFASPPEPQARDVLLAQVLQIAAPQKLLDVGCSAGAVVQLLRERGIDAHGFDVCPDLAHGADAPAAPFVHSGALDAIPFGPEHGFDTLLALDVFEHIPEHQVGAMVAEFARLGVRRLVAQISLCEFQYAGHITLRPLSWWDRQLAPWFHRVVPRNQRDLAAAFDADPARYLRVYELASVPAAV